MWGLNSRPCVCKVRDSHFLKLERVQRDRASFLMGLLDSGLVGVWIETFLVLCHRKENHFIHAPFLTYRCQSQCIFSTKDYIHPPPFFFLFWKWHKRVWWHHVTWRNAWRFDQPHWSKSWLYVSSRLCVPFPLSSGQLGGSTLHPQRCGHHNNSIDHGLDCCLEMKRRRHLFRRLADKTRNPNVLNLIWNK